MREAAGGMEEGGNGRAITDLASGAGGGGVVVGRKDRRLGGGGGRAGGGGEIADFAEGIFSKII